MNCLLCDKPAPPDDGAIWLEPAEKTGILHNIRPDKDYVCISCLCKYKWAEIVEAVKAARAKRNKDAHV